MNGTPQRFPLLHPSSHIHPQPIVQTLHQCPSNPARHICRTIRTVFTDSRHISPNPHNLLRSTICHPVHCIHHSCDHYHQQHLHQQHFHLKNLNPHIVKICQKQREYSNYCTSCCHRVRKDPAKLYPDRPFSVSIIRSQTL